MRFSYPALLLPLLASCGPVNRGLETVHQPVVDAAGAHVSGCPDWRADEALADVQETTSSNYGCATMTNLAAMIADPNDLLHGKSSPDTGMDPKVTAKAIKVWREAPPTGAAPLEKQKTSNGVGQ